MQLANRFQAFVVGANQPVGYFLSRILAAQNYRYSSLSLESREQLKVQNGGKPFLVLLPTIYEPESFKHLEFWLEQAKELDIPVLLLSSLAVFESPADEAGRLETDTDYAKQELAQLVLQAEALTAALPRHLILRAGALFSFMSADFANDWLVSMRAHEALSLDDKALFNPTPADDAATVILAMLQQANCMENLWGLYHFNAVEPVACYSFAKALQAEAGHYESFETADITSQEQQGFFKPWLPSADNTKLFYYFGIKPKSWRKGLIRLLAKHYEAG